MVMEINPQILSTLKDATLKAVTDILVREAVEKLASRIPFLFAGPLGALGEMLVRKAIVWGIAELSCFIDMKLAGFETRRQLKEMEKIIDRVKNAQTTLTPEEEGVINEAMRVAAFQLIHIK